MQSLTMIRENAHGTPKTISGVSSTALTTSIDSNALEHIGDLSLTAEVTRYHEASRLFFQYQEEIRKIEERLWQAGQLKDASGRRLEGANTLHRIEEALEDLNHRSRVRHGNTRR